MRSPIPQQTSKPHLSFIEHNNAAVWGGFPKSAQQSGIARSRKSTSKCGEQKGDGKQIGVFHDALIAVVIDSNLGDRLFSINSDSYLTHSRIGKSIGWYCASESAPLDQDRQLFPFNSHLRFDNHQGTAPGKDDRRQRRDTDHR